MGTGTTARLARLAMERESSMRSDLKKSDFMAFKDPRTKKAIFVTRFNLEIVDWGHTFLVNTELQAFRCASAFHCRTHVVWSIEFEMFHVTVFSAEI